MDIKHENVDTGAEADQFRENFNNYETLVTSDTHDDITNITTIEYIVGEGDPPFGKYRLTLEPIDTCSADDYNILKASKKAAE